jgi:hypothetical protein
MIHFTAFALAPSPPGWLMSCHIAALDHDLGGTMLSIRATGLPLTPINLSIGVGSAHSSLSFLLITHTEPKGPILSKTCLTCLTFCRHGYYLLKAQPTVCYPQDTPHSYAYEAFHPSLPRLSCCHLATRVLGFQHLLYSGISSFRQITLSSLVFVDSFSFDGRLRQRLSPRQP